MSNLLEQASLVMIPSGYAEDIVYSEIPLDGSGDMNFTRSSNGTRINSAGLVEVCPWNLVQQSESIGTSPWLTNGATLTSGQTDPNGGTTAIKVQLASGGNNYVYQGIPLTNPVNIVSAYLRADSATTIGFSMGGSTPNAVNLTTSWQLFTFSSTDTSGGIIFDNYFGPSPTQQAKTFYIWHPQLNIGSTAKPYFPTTDRLNVPRLTYQNGGGGCPSLLLEKQSTNLITYSEDINNSFTSKVGVTITSNNTTSPDGTQNADLLKFDTTSGYVLRNQTVNATTTYTMSVFVKNNNFTSGQLLTFNMSDGVIGGLAAQINVVAKTATYSGASGAWTSVSGKVEDYGNGWFRVSVTGTSIGGGGGWYEMAASGVTNSCYVWGLSLETSSYPTTYIPTTSASATRVADVCVKTGISSLIGQTEGVIFVDFDFNAKYSSSGVIPISANNPSVSGNVCYIFVTTSNDLLVEMSNSSGVQCSIVGSIGAVGRKKIAFAYKQNDFVVYMNGTQIGTDTSGSVVALSELRIGGYLSNPSFDLNAGVNQAVLFKTRLTNAELASLTTI